MAEQNDTLQVVSTAEVIDVYSEGPVGGLWSAGSKVDKFKAVYYDGAPLKSLETSGIAYKDKDSCNKAGGTWVEDPIVPGAGYCDFLNYPGTQIEERKGTLTQSPLNTGDLSSATTPVNVGARLYHGRPIVRTISNTDVDSVRVVISLPQLFAQVKADIVATEVEIEIAVRASGQEAYVKADLRGQEKFKGKSSSEYRRSYRINLRPFGDPPYDIKVSRVTPDSEKVGTRNETYWHSYNEITNVLLSMPHTAAVKSTIKAEYTGGRFPSVRQFLVLGRIVKVPSNYFTNIDSEGNVTRYTDGVWDGTFKEAWTNNPAWIFYDVVTHTRYSIGDVVVPWMLDKWKLYSIAAQCDQMVKTGRKDGLGNDVMEHRFSASVQLLEPRDALLVIRDMASVFRGMATWHAGGLFVTQDVPSDPVAQYTAANVVNGEFSYTGASRQNRTTAVLVTYLDSNNNYQKVTDCVEAPSSYIERYGYNQTEVVAFACSSRSQAHRLARYILYTSMMEHDIVNFKVGIDSLLAAPGQIVRVVDKNKSDTLAGGRIASVISQTEVILDRDITLEVGHTYTLTCSMPDGTLSSNTVTNAPGVVTKGSVVTLSGPLSAEPVAFAVWTLVSDQSPTVLYRIVGIKEAPIEDKPGHFFEVTATAYDPEKYAQIDDVQEVVLPDLYDPRAEVVPMPEDAIFYKGVDSSGRYLDVIWLASTGQSIKEYEVRWVHNGKSTLHTVDDLSFRITNPTSGLHEFFITAINVAGVRSQPLDVQYYYENLVELPKINGLEVKGQGNDTTFSGDEVTIVWRAPIVSGDGASALDNDPFTAGIGVEQPELVPVADYLVTTYDADGNKLSDRTAATNAFTYTLDMNRADGGPRRSFIFGVAARDAYGRVGDETRLLVSNPAPKAVSGLLIEPGMAQAAAWFTPPTDPDWKHVEFHVSTTPGFVPDATTLALISRASPAVIPDLVDGAHYCRAISVDSFGYDASSVTSEVMFEINTPGAILDEVRGKIDESILEQALGARIDLIDAPGGLVDTAAAHATDLLAHAEDLASKGQAIAALEAAVTDPVSGLSANASAITALDTRVVSAEGAISSHSTSITALQNSLATTDGAVSANAAAITALDTRVDSAEGAISSHSTSITALQNSLAITDGAVSANASAITALDTRVGSAEGAISSHTTQLTSLAASLEENEPVSPAPGCLWSFNGDVEGWQPLKNATLTPNANSVTFTTTGTDPQLARSITVDGNKYHVVKVRIRRVSGAGAWEGQCYYKTAGHGYAAGYYKSISDPGLVNGVWRVLTWDMSSLSAGGDDWITNTITGIRFDFTQASGDVYEIDWIAIAAYSPAASAEALSLVDARVGSAEGVISAHSTSITQLSTTVGNHTASIETVQTSVDGLSAQYTIKVDSNGVVAGMGLAADATSSEFAVRADKISFLAGGVKWAATTAKSVGDVAVPTTGPNGLSYVVKVAGTTGSTEPTWPTVVGNLVVDGTVTWEAVNARPFRIEGGKTYIDTAFIGVASIADAMIGSVSAAKIKTGVLDVGEHLTVSSGGLVNLEMGAVQGTQPGVHGNDTALTYLFRVWDGLDGNSTKFYFTDDGEFDVKGIIEVRGGGYIELEPGGSLRAGKDSYASTVNGVFIGDDGGVFKLHIGNNVRSLKWDGTDVTATGRLRADNVIDTTYGLPCNFVKQLKYALGAATGTFNINLGTFASGGVINVKINYIDKTSAPYRMKELPGFLYTPAGGYMSFWNLFRSSNNFYVSFNATAFKNGVLNRNDVDLYISLFVNSLETQGWSGS